MILFIPTMLTFVMVSDNEPGAQNPWLKWVILGALWILAIALIAYTEWEARTQSKSKNRKTLELKILDVLGEAGINTLNIEVEYPDAAGPKKLTGIYTTTEDLGDLIRERMHEKGVSTIKTVVSVPKCKDFELDMKDFLTQLGLADKISAVELAASSIENLEKS